MKTCVICSNKLQGLQQKFCSNKCKQKGHYDRVKEQTNTYHSQTTRALKRKLKLIEMMGGGCKHCGYAANISALHFHHVDASEKSFKLGARILSSAYSCFCIKKRVGEKWVKKHSIFNSPKSDNVYHENQ